MIDITPLGIALSAVIVFAVPFLLRQYVRGLRSGDPFAKPLRDGRDEWNTKR